MALPGEFTQSTVVVERHAAQSEKPATPSPPPPPAAVWSTPAPSSAGVPTRGQRAQHLAEQLRHNVAARRTSHVPDVFWQLGTAVSDGRCLLPGQPSHAISMAAIHQWQRKLMYERLTQRGELADDGRPWASDPAAIVRAYPMRWGTSPVKGPLRPRQWLEGHQLHCERCAAVGAGRHDRGCYFDAIFNILTYGWSVAFDAEPGAHEPRRPRIDKAHQAALDEDIRKMLAHGWCTIMPRGTKSRVTSARFVVDKQKLASSHLIGAIYRGEVNPADPTIWKVKHRVVVDLKASGVNAAASKVHIRMPPIGDAIQLCTTGGYGAVADIASGYYHVPLADDVTRDWLTFEQLFDGEWRQFRPTRMSFGAHASSAVFCMLSAESRLILAAHGIEATVWVDDWFFAHPTKTGCETAFKLGLQVLRGLGWTFNESKLVHATQQVPWLGWIVDLQRQRLVVPETKRARIMTLVQQCLQQRQQCPTALLATTFGLISWACWGVQAGRAFTVAIGIAASRKSRHTRLSPLAVDDLEFWARNQRQWSGSPLMLGDRIKTSAFLSDASGDVGYGAHTGSWFIHGIWRRDQLDESVPYKELYAVKRMLQAMVGYRPGDGSRSTPAPATRRSVVFVGTDAAGNCFRLNSGRAGRVNSRALATLRQIHELTFQHRISLIALHIPRDCNLLADELSKAESHVCAHHVFARRVPARATDRACGGCTLDARRVANKPKHAGQDGERAASHGQA